MKKLLPIGSREVVALPEQGITNIPAKIDTGADSTSIWASNIKEHNGVLSYTLFAPGSHYYTGQVITTSDYKVTYVKNSFGHGEERYKVKLLMRVRTKRIRVELTLADRSRNRYPVLIGKATLRNRFFVDVRHDGVLKGKVPTKVLVMNSKHSGNVRKLFEDIAADDPGIICDVASYADIRFDIINGVISCSILRHGKTLEDYDLIYFKTYFAQAELAAAMTEIAIVRGIPFIDEEVAQYSAKTKLTQYLRLARHGVNVPDSVVMPYAKWSGRYPELCEVLGERFVMKNVASEQGESNYMVSSESEYEEIAAQIYDEKAIYVAQAFVENDGDYRVLVLDKKIGLIIHRRSGDSSSHLNNTSKGGQATQVTIKDLGAEPAAIAIRASVIMNRQVAGVDLVFDMSKKCWYVFEVNNSPQIAGGSFLDEKRAIVGRFLKDYVKK